jgi:acyl carrier protein
MTPAPEIAAGLERFIRERFQVPPEDAGFSTKTHLWREGYVDSIGAAEVLAFLEGAFKVSIPMEIYFDETCTSIEGIAAFVSKLPPRG